MSYEGYDVWYCSKGHRVLQMDAHCHFVDDEVADQAMVCPICGEKACTRDSVDETNGCYCDSMNEEDKAKYGKCPCHESVETVIRYDLFPCPHCAGVGEKEITISWQWVSCDVCTSETACCEKCKDYGLIPIPHKTQKVECSCCFGRGVVYAEAWDISHLLERDRKQQEEIAEMHKRCYIDVRVNELREKGCWEAILEEFKTKDIEEELIQENAIFTLSKEQAERFGFLKEEDRGLE